jgi:ribosomal protein S18 acetylase RimI-like enzyme
MAETVDGTEFAGSIEMRPMDDSYSHFMLQNLVVSPTLRRIGVATALMDTIDKLLTGKLGDYPLSPWKQESSEVVAQYHYAWMTHFKGLPPRIILELHVNPENLPAIDLYKKSGYVIQPMARLPFFSIGLHKMVKYVANAPQLQNVDASSSASLTGREERHRKLQPFM